MLNFILSLIILFLIGILLRMKKRMKKIRDTIEDENTKSKSKILQETEEAYQSLKRIHFEDTLTKLPNRFALLRDLESYGDGTFMLMDIARFNAVNDIYGVEIGNELLIALSSYVLKLSKGRNVTIYRVGSDEFVCISKEPIIKCQEHFRRLFTKIDKNNFSLADGTIELQIELNAGISKINEQSFENATLALQYAKEHRLEYFIYTESLQKTHNYSSDADIIKKIKSVIQNNCITPYFHAIVDRDKNVVKYEALMRFIIKSKVVTPNEFLEVAQYSKYYHEMTRIIIQKTLAVFKNREEGISINLNMIDIKNTTTVMLIVEELKKFPNANRVTFELLESESMYSGNEAISFIEEIRKHGAKIAIDDFGTGYSNFSYLMRMSPDYIKVDGSLISKIDIDKQAYAIVKSIVEFTHALDIESVGEYIHSKAVFDTAKELKIDLFQGHHFHEPEAL